MAGEQRYKPGRAGNGPSDQGFQPRGVAAVGAFPPSPRRPGAGAAHRRSAGLRPAGWMAQLPPMDLFGALLFQVTGRQLSVPATRRTLARIQALFGGHLPAPAELLAVDPAQLRQAGLSWRKIGTLRDLAERLTDGRLDQDVLSTLPDDELMAELTAIPGIGPWTVQGAMLVALRREDVVLPGDLALRKAIQAAYQLDHRPTQE